MEDSRDVDACLVLGVRKAGGIADQTARDGELPKREHRRDRVEARQRHQLIAAAIEKRAVREEKGFDSSLNERREGCIDLVFVAGVQEQQLQPERACRLSQLGSLIPFPYQYDLAM